MPFPDLLAHIWSAFMELHSARPSGAMGPSVLTYEGIKAWMECTGQWLAPWEVAAVKRLDRVWAKIQGEQQQARKSGQ